MNTTPSNGSSASSADDFFSQLSEDWNSIAKRLTLTYSLRQKREAKALLETALSYIANKITTEAAAANETEANRWRHADFLVRSITAEFSMWISVDRKRFDDAWKNFCDAEFHAKWVAGWLPDNDMAQSRVRHLSEVERVVFPKQAFFSSGLIAASETCMICNSEYGTCGHVVGEIYSGEVAWKRVKPKEFIEVSLVNDPADKRCRVTNAGGVDTLTGNEVQPQPLVRNYSNKRQSRKQRKRGKR